LLTEIYKGPPPFLIQKGTVAQRHADKSQTMKEAKLIPAMRACQAHFKQKLSRPKIIRCPPLVDSCNANDGYRWSQQFTAVLYLTSTVNGNHCRHLWYILFSNCLIRYTFIARVRRTPFMKLIAMQPSCFSASRNKEVLTLSLLTFIHWPRKVSNGYSQMSCSALAADLPSLKRPEIQHTDVLFRETGFGVWMTFTNVVDQFRYIRNIQPKTIDLSARFWGMNTEFVGFIPQSLVLRFIVLSWILICRNWSNGDQYLT